MCVTLSGIWFLSAAAAARTLTVVLTSSIYRSTEFLSTHLVVIGSKRHAHIRVRIRLRVMIRIENLLLQ